MIGKDLKRLLVRLKQKWFYSPHSYYKLNVWTLQLNDKEIYNEYNNERLARIDRGWPWVQFFTIVYVLFRLI